MEGGNEKSQGVVERGVGRNERNVGIGKREVKAKNSGTEGTDGEGERQEKRNKIMIRENDLQENGGGGILNDRVLECGKSKG